MKIGIFFTFFFLAFSKSNQKERAEEIVSYINKNNFGWKAENNQFSEMSFEEKKKMLINIEEFYRTPKFEEPDFGDFRGEIPKFFDSAEKWKNCSSITNIRNQGHCGSCWAHGLSETISDRFCIYSNGEYQVNLSPQDAVSCDHLSLGCNGGWPEQSFFYAKNHGLVTEECYPYHSGTTQKRGECTKKCRNGKDWQEDKHYIHSFHSIHKNVTKIQQEIMQHGSVSVSFLVYEEFFAYKEGVYRHKKGLLGGGHVVKITGWGETVDGTPYWTVVNNWGKYWGEKGTFKILRGTNECFIERAAFGCTPKLK